MVSNDLKTKLKKMLFARPRLAAIFYRFLYGLRSLRFAFFRRSYSQDGEDEFVLNYFRRTGVLDQIYIDIGANDPRMLSNTYLLYKMGWRGVTVEPIAELSEKHKRCRPRDLCINAGIGSKEEKVSFWEMIPHVYSSFDQGAANAFVDANLAVIKLQRQLDLIPFSAILERFPQSNRASLLCLDTEGFDAFILKQVPWERFSPTLILSEQGPDTEVGSLLEGQGYRLIHSFSTNSLYEKPRYESDSATRTLKSTSNF